MYPIDSLAVPALWLVAAVAGLWALISWLRDRHRADPRRRSEWGPALDTLRELHIVTGRQYGKTALCERAVRRASGHSADLIIVDDPVAEGDELALNAWVDSPASTAWVLENDRRRRAR